MTSTSPDLVTCSTTAEFLRALPKLTGFTASNSLFVVFFSGSRAQRSARLTLPESFDSPVERAYIEGISDMIRELSKRFKATDNPVLVITTDQSFAAAGGAPHRAFARRMQRCLMRDGITLRNFCVVAADGWGEFDDPKLPQAGRALADIAPLWASGTSVAHGGKTGGDAGAGGALADQRDVPALTEIGAIPAPNESKIALADAVGHELKPLPQPEQQAGAGSRSDPSAPRRMREVGAVARALLNFDTPLQPRMIARLLRLVNDTDMWFALTLALLTRASVPEEIVKGGEQSSFTRVPIGEPNEPHPADDHPWSIYALLASFSSECERPQVFVRLRQRMSEVLESTADIHRPHVLALSSWVWWTSGLQSVAIQQVEAALQLAPTDELCLMVRALTDAPLFGRVTYLSEEASDCRAA